MKKIVFGMVSLIMGLLLLSIGLMSLAVILTYPKLPSLEALTDYRPKIPLRVFSADGILIGEFGEEKRAFLPIDKTPDIMKKALLAAEDERFYRHGGVDYIGVLRAMVSHLIPGNPRSGASTITMQVARNFYLSNEKTLTRKFNEALLSFKIEHNLSKDQIFELYINQIYLGRRAYGFAAAAQTYFGKEIGGLSIAQTAMLAGLPKAPSASNPIANFQRAKQRQLYVLRRMHELRFIDDAQYDAAKKEPLRLYSSGLGFSVHAEYVAEMVRQMMFDRYKEATYAQGFRVYTTVNSKDQNAAYKALRQGLLSYSIRHGYHGPEHLVNITSEILNDGDALDEILSEVYDSDDLKPAIVLSVHSKAVRAYVKHGESILITGEGLKFAQAYLTETTPRSIRPGAIIRVRQINDQWFITQTPRVEGAFVAMDPNNGEIKALVGGFDFNRNSFNHVVQAWRQPGSSFKPFIYSAALEKGITPTTLINDAPLVIDTTAQGGQRWEPKNYGGKYAGMIPVRDALTRSKNLVSIRILQAITPQYVQRYISRFGFSPDAHPAYLTMALGAGSISPLQLAEGYAVFANTGYRVHSHFVSRIEDNKGRILAQTQPEIAGKNARRTLEARNAFVMTSMMRDVIEFGTGSKAKALGRKDLAGKTGTTNDSLDTWFAGFHPHLVAVVWIGFDQPKSLGSHETGSTTALPVWVNFMGMALKGIPEVHYPVPEGIVEEVVNGLRGPRTEYFFSEFTDTNPELGLGGGNDATSASPTSEEAKDLLF